MLGSPDNPSTLCYQPMCDRMSRHAPPRSQSNTSAAFRSFRNATGYLWIFKWNVSCFDEFANKSWGLPALLTRGSAFIRARVHATPQQARDHDPVVHDPFGKQTSFYRRHDLTARFYTLIPTNTTSFMDATIQHPRYARHLICYGEL